jgi:signal transduction histidine kinase
MRDSHKDFVKKLKFELVETDSEYMVYADKDRLRQVIFNLLENSVKSISEKEINEGFISISMKEIIIKDNQSKLKDAEYSEIADNPLKMINISVTDTGKGIDKAIQNRLFTKFASKSYQGTGLGLYITRNIIEMHGGRIWIEKNEKEVGTTISFSLPISYK